MKICYLNLGCLYKVILWQRVLLEGENILSGMKVNFLFLITLCQYWNKCTLSAFYLFLFVKVFHRSLQDSIHFICFVLLKAYLSILR